MDEVRRLLAASLPRVPPTEPTGQDDQGRDWDGAEFRPVASPDPDQFVLGAKKVLDSRGELAGRTIRWVDAKNLASLIEDQRELDQLSPSDVVNEIKRLKMPEPDKRKIVSALRAAGA